MKLLGYREAGMRSNARRQVSAPKELDGCPCHGKQKLCGWFLGTPGKTRRMLASARVYMLRIRRDEQAESQRKEYIGTKSNYKVQLAGAGSFFHRKNNSSWGLYLQQCWWQ